MYDYGRRVYVRSLGVVGRVTERNYLGNPRHACYVIALEDGGDWMCGSTDLRGADYCCDGCGSWRPGTPHATAPDGEYPNGLAFCFLCAGPPVEREALRAMRAAL